MACTSRLPAFHDHGFAYDSIENSNRFIPSLLIRLFHEQSIHLAAITSLPSFEYTILKPSQLPQASSPPSEHSSIPLLSLYRVTSHSQSPPSSSLCHRPMNRHHTLGIMPGDGDRRMRKSMYVGIPRLPFWTQPSWIQSNSEIHSWDVPFISPLRCTGRLASELSKCDQVEAYLEDPSDLFSSAPRL